MQITNSWIHTLSEWWEIQLLPNLAVTLIDDGGMEDIHLIVPENTQVEYIGYMSEKGHSIEVQLLWAKSKIHFRSVLLARWEEDITSQIRVDVAADKSQADVKILSISSEGGSIGLDGIISIPQGIHGAKGKLTEKNLFLWDSGKIKGIPQLLVASSDVEANHACNIERISDEKLFYLRSRGVGRENALAMMIEAELRDMYRCYSMIDSGGYEQLLEKILKKIQ